MRLHCAERKAIRFCLPLAVFRPFCRQSFDNLVTTRTHPDYHQMSPTVRTPKELCGSGGVYVDEVMRRVQSPSAKAAVVGHGAVRVRMGVVRTPRSEDRKTRCKSGRQGCMAKVIEFYIPSTFRKSGKWVPAEQRGKIIEFVGKTKKTA